MKRRRVYQPGSRLQYLDRQGDIASGIIWSYAAPSGVFVIPDKAPGTTVRVVRRRRFHVVATP